MSSTLAQITANRANSQYSTGPKSAEGINNCKFNATRHGLTGKQLVIKGEDPAEYDALRAGFLATYGPADEKEAMLVEEIAQNWWRLQRARRVEAELIGKFGDLACLTQPEAMKPFDRVERYLRSIERAWTFAVKELKALQAARAKAERESEPARPRPIGSVSQASVTPVPDANADAIDSPNAAPQPAPGSASTPPDPIGPTPISANRRF